MSMHDQMQPWRRRLRRRALLRGGALGGAGLALAALVGCGDDDADDEPAAQQPKPADQKPGQATRPITRPDTVEPPYPLQVAEPGGKTPKPGGTVRVPITWANLPFDMTKSQSSSAVAIPTTASNGLLTFVNGPKMDPLKLEVIPWLAKSWETAPDGLTLTFKLNGGVKFHNVAPVNGRAFTAKDVAAIFKWYAADGLNKVFFESVDSVNAVDDLTVQVKMKASDPDFLTAAASRYLTIPAPELVERNLLAKQMIGTGSMILKEAKPGESYVFEKNPDYWEGKPNVDGITFVVTVDPAARLAAFRAGQTDFLGGTIQTVRDAQALLGTHKDVMITCEGIPNSVGGGIAMNLDKPRFQDVRVRRALQLAMDTKKQIEIAYQGVGKILPLSPWAFVFDKEQDTDLGEWWRFDPAEARKLLEAAGVPNLQLDYLFYQTGTSEQIVVLRKEQLAQVGVTLNLTKLDTTAFNALWVGRDPKFEIGAGWPTTGLTPNDFFYSHLHSKSPNNRWHVSDPQIDQWAEQQRVELDPKKRREILRKIWDKELDQVFRVPNPNTFVINVYQPWLRNFRVGGTLQSIIATYDWGPQAHELWLDK